MQNPMFFGQNKVGGASPTYATGSIAFSGVPDGVYGRAAGTLTFAVCPSNNDTLPALYGFSGIVFKDGAGAFPEIQIQSDGEGPSLSPTLTELGSQLEANKGESGNEALADANYLGSGRVLQVTYNAIGTAGNAYTLGADTANITRSGPTLTGGGENHITVGGFTFSFWDSIGDGPPFDYIDIVTNNTAALVAAAVAQLINDHTVDATCTATALADTVTLTANAAGSAGNSTVLEGNATNCALTPFAGGQD